MPESHDLEISEEKRRLSRDLEEFLPKQGDRLIRETPLAARVDPTGSSDPNSPESRSAIGRWGLYSDGYLQAGDRLVESLTSSPSEDELIYPILYLYRHHFELELKALILYCQNWLLGHSADEVQSFAAKELSKTHSLRKLWNILKKCCPNYDKGMSSRTSKTFESLLFELDDHDPNAQAARYPSERSGNQTLPRLRSVDLLTFKMGVHKMSHYLGWIREAIGQEIDWRAEMASW